MRQFSTIPNCIHIWEQQDWKTAEGRAEVKGDLVHDEGTVEEKPEPDDSKFPFKHEIFSF